MEASGRTGGLGMHFETVTQPGDEIEIAAPAKEEILVRLNDALAELQAASREQAEVVKLRFFVGLSEPEIAGILRISERSVQRQWSFARAWLF